MVNGESVRDVPPGVLAQFGKPWDQVVPAGHYFVIGERSEASSNVKYHGLIPAGLNRREQYAITSSMLNSGTIMDFSDIDAPKADKHSTGGVGDKTSLLIARVNIAIRSAVIW